MVTGCTKKTVAIKTITPEPPKPTPTVSITLSTNSIERGKSSNIRWTSTNADSVLIDGIGYVNPSGTQSVTPMDSIMYQITAKGPGGTATDSAHLTVTALVAAEKPQPVVKPSETDEQWFARHVKDVYFNYDSFTLRDDAKAAIHDDSATLVTRNWNYVIEGHCDERGSTEYNLTLGDERATATRDALIAAGVPASRISIVSYGKEKPLCSEETDACFQHNRVAHFALKK